MPTIYRNKINYGGSIYLAGSGVTAGIITPYGGSAAPTGWLLCDGSAVSRTGYSQLFDAIGTTYGSGDGSTTFNLPNLQGVFLLGSNANYDVGDTGGEENVTLDVTEMPSHNHSYGQYLVANSATGNSWTGDNQYYVAIRNKVSSTAAIPSGPVGSESNIHTQGHMTSSGGNQPHNNMPPYAVVNYIISIGSQNGGFTPLFYDGADYQGGIDNEYLMLSSTIAKWDALLGDANIDKIANYLADNIGTTTTSISAINSIEGTMYLYKDSLAKTVRGYCYFRKSTDIAFDTVIFKIPAGYRPLTEITRPCFLQTSGGTGAYYCRFTTNGNVQQRMGSTVRSGYMAFEYDI